MTTPAREWNAPGETQPDKMRAALPETMPIGWPFSRSVLPIWTSWVQKRIEDDRSIDAKRRDHAERIATSTSPVVVAKILGFDGVTDLYEAFWMETHR